MPSKWPVRRSLNPKPHILGASARPCNAESLKFDAILPLPKFVLCPVRFKGNPFRPLWIQPVRLQSSAAIQNIGTMWE